MDYISTKVLAGLGMILLIIISDLLQYKGITLIQILTAFLIGFFIPDILLI